jgi:iron complex outermembrane receptor protein
VGFFAILVTVMPGPVLTQEPPVALDTVRTVATRLTPALSTHTRAVEVLDRESLDAMPVGTVVQALAWAFGADVMARSAAQADLSIRGSSFEQVLVLVNGVSASDPQTGHFDLDLTMPLSRVERIEVLRGPASALYGADAMGGVVNIVTRAPATHLEGRVEGGSFETLSGSVDAGHSIGATDLAMGAGYRRSGGHRPGTDHRLVELYVEAASPLLSGEASVRAGRSWKDFGAADFYAPFPSYEETRTTMLVAAWSGRLAGGFHLEPRVHWRRHRDHFILDREDPALYSNNHLSSQIGAETVVRYEGGSGMSGAVGAQVGRDILESSNLGDLSEERWAGFAEAAFQQGPMTINAGIRGDHHDSFGLFVSPSVSAALQWEPLRVRGSVARSFRAPTWMERYYQDPANRGSPDLDPERAWTAELGLDLQLERAWLSLTTYRRRATDLIDWARPVASQATQWETRNVESATFRGVEAELTGVTLWGVHTSVQGSLLDLHAAEASGFESKYALRPLTRDVSLKLARDVGLLATNARVTYRTRDGGSAFWLLDLRVAVQLPRGEVFLDLLNGLDANYSDVSGAPAAGRALVAGLRLRWL